MKPPPPVFHRLLASGVVHVAFAFLFMGAWAAFVNRAHGFGEAAQAGLVQGALSGAITLSLKRAIDFLSVRFSGIMSFLAPPLIACSISLCVLVIAHLIAGTPEILATIAAPFSVAFSYAALYSLSRWRMRRNIP